MNPDDSGHSHLSAAPAGATHGAAVSLEAMRAAHASALAAAAAAAAAASGVGVGGGPQAALNAVVGRKHPRSEMALVPMDAGGMNVMQALESAGESSTGELNGVGEGGRLEGDDDDEEEEVEEEEDDARGGAGHALEEDDDEDDAGAGDHASLGADAGAAGPGGGLPTGRRMRLTLGQKREVVDLAASKKFTHKELAEKFRVGRTTITNICRQEDLIRTETDSADATKKKRKTTKCTYDLRVLDECLHKWRMEVKVSAPDTKLTGTILQQKAMDIAMKIQQDPFAELPDKVRVALSKFSASNGWLDGYRTRFGSFSSKQLHGDSSVIKNVDIQTRLRELHHSLVGVELQDIWTASEFAVMYKQPGGSVPPGAATGFPGPGTLGDGVAATLNTGRLTVTLLVSAAGETFDMQVVGVDRSPVVLDGINTQQEFSLHYGYSKTGWQVANTMVNILKALNGLAKQRKRTFRVILDSAVPHVKAAMMLDSQGDQRTFFVYDHLQLYFLPPNFKPPRFHPCHLGIIQAFKARFRYELVETLYTTYRQSMLAQQPQGFVHPARFLHTRNVFHWLYVALHSLDKHLIQHCWVQSGLLPTQVIAHLDMKQIARVAQQGGSAPAPSQGSSHHATVPYVLARYRELQQLMDEIRHIAPSFLQWVGVSDPTNAQAYVELEGNASVTDPGIDELQIIRSVLQKHGFLSTKRLDDASHAGGHFESLADVAHEQCPMPEEVLASVEILKKYLRLTRDKIPARVDAIVQLNKLKAHVGTARSGGVHDVSGHSIAM
ncbi:hypothetical protein P43SY_008863 [Pythium insidiosum]|uniref:DDE-1 domain-containing protein n=1 Tax=Pythium insidiosum TaxID=114742 RepID=A0AAD5LQE4_PYTIN|nr:hypothetical protein P43SY_008863 [Pythium insidiosum]